MQRWAVFGLSLLAACSGGGGPLVLSGGPEFLPDGGAVISPPESGALGHQAFALVLNDVRAAKGIAVVMENSALNAAAVPMRRIWWTQLSGPYQP